MILSIGNAVPSLLAETLAREIRKQFFNHTIKSGPKLLHKKRLPIPNEEAVASVPKAYLSDDLTLARKNKT